MCGKRSTRRPVNLTLFIYLLRDVNPQAKPSLPSTAFGTTRNIPRLICYSNRIGRSDNTDQCKRITFITYGVILHIFVLTF